METQCIVYATEFVLNESTKLQKKNELMKFLFKIF